MGLSKNRFGLYEDTGAGRGGFGAPWMLSPPGGFNPKGGFIVGGFIAGGFITGGFITAGRV